MAAMVEMIYDSLTAAQFFTAIANFLILLMLVLLAKGWTIVRRHLSPNGVVKIVVYASTYFMILIFAQMYVYGAYDETRSTVYFYTSPPWYYPIIDSMSLGRRLVQLRLLYHTTQFR